MEPKRLAELLTYAKVCFDSCTSPFELTHLIKKQVKSDECIDLSHQIGEIIAEWLYDQLFIRDAEVDKLIEQAKKEFEETQK
jgi:uracil phosphoribosyltransferase